MSTLTVLATEAGHVAPSHIAAQLAVPLGFLIFGGGVYALLWSVYGAKKGALIYSVAFFGFAFILGVFWWFGAPGTPVATGLQNFPGQAPDAYQGKWYGFEPGSERADSFPLTKQGFDAFTTIGGYLGEPNATNEQLEDSPYYNFLRGDIDGGSSKMLEQYLPTDASGTVLIGAERRQTLTDAAGPAQTGERPASPFFTARAKEIRVSDSNGTRIAAAELETVANFAFSDANGAPKTREVVVSTDTWYAFKDPGRLWFPSAVWVSTALLLFVLSMFGLDRMEQREKKKDAEAEESVAAPEPVGANA